MNSPLVFAVLAIGLVAGCAPAPAMQAPPPARASGPTAVPLRPPGSPPLPHCEAGMAGDCVK